MASETRTKRLIGKEDIEWGITTSSQAASVLVDQDGNAITLNQVNGSHMPFLTQQNSVTKYIDDIVDGGYDVSAKLLDMIAKSGVYVDVRAHGATGDGTTDDTTAIQAALDSVSSGGSVYFPPGTYLITASLLMKYSNVHIFGAGVESQIKTTTLGVDIFINSGAIDNVIIEKLYLLGSTSNDSNDAGIVLGFSANASAHVVIKDCFIENVSSYGIYILNDVCSDVFIIGNTIKNCGDGFSQLGAGILASGTYVRIIGNHVEQCSANGIDSNATKSVIANNVCKGNGTSVINFDTPARNGIYVGVAGVADVTVVGNICESNGNATYVGHGISTGGTGLKNVNIVGNYCYSNKSRGISASGICVITGNTCKSNTSRGIYASSYCTVTGNQCELNSNEIEVDSYCVVTGNVCVDGTAAGILVDGDENIISNNTCKHKANLTQTHGIHLIAASNRNRIINNLVYPNLTNTIYDQGTDNVLVGNIIDNKLTYYVDSGFALKYNSADADYTMDTNDYSRFADASGGAIIITLPQISAIKAGSRFYFVKTDNSSNGVTIRANATDKINGFLDFHLNNQSDSVEIMCDDSTTWRIVGRYFSSSSSSSSSSST